jgi:hypothetical protein
MDPTYTTTNLLGLAVIIANSPTTSTQDTIVHGLERMGSFFLVAVFVIAVLWGLNKLVPTMIANIEKTKDQFLEALREERHSREKNVDAFRDMLREHKIDIVNKLDEGNKIMKGLAGNLDSRPCQMTKRNNNNNT